jgi:hypothetical protein
LAVPGVTFVFILAKRHNIREQKRGDANDDRAQFHDEFPTSTNSRRGIVAVTEPAVEAQQSAGRSLAHVRFGVNRVTMTQHRPLPVDPDERMQRRTNVSNVPLTEVAAKGAVQRG